MNKRVSFLVASAFIMCFPILIFGAQFAKRVGTLTLFVHHEGKAAGPSCNSGYSFLLSGGSSNVGWINVANIKDLDGSLGNTFRIYRNGPGGEDYSLNGFDISRQITAINPGFAVAGKYHDYQDPENSDAFVYAVNNGGNYQFRVGGALDDDFNAIEATSDGGYIVAGTDTVSGSPSHGNLLVGKLSGGTFAWLNSYNFFDTAHSLNLDDKAYDIGVVNQNPQGYVVVGSTITIGSSRKRGFILLLDNNGNVTQFTTIQDTTKDIEFTSVKFAYGVGFPSPIFLLAGRAGTDSLFLRIDRTTLSPIWYTCINGGSNDKVESVLLANGAVIGDISGVTAGGVTLAKLDANTGAVSSLKNYQEFTDTPLRLGLATDGDVLIPAEWPLDSNAHKSVLIKTTSDFGGLPNNCGINSISYNTVTLNLTNTTSDTIVQPPTAISAITADASIENPSMVITNNCQDP